MVFRDEVGGAREERLKEEEAVLLAKLGSDVTGGALCAGVVGALLLAPPAPAAAAPPCRSLNVERQIFSSGWTLGFPPVFLVGVLGLESWFWFWCGLLFWSPELLLMPEGGAEGVVELLCPLASLPEDLCWFCSGWGSTDGGLVLMGRTRLRVWCSDWVRTRTGLVLFLSAAGLQG